MSDAKTAKAQKRNALDRAAASDAEAASSLAVDLDQPVLDLNDDMAADKNVAEAKQELEAIVDASAVAASAILDACEVIETASKSIPTGALRDSLQEATRNIYLACGFQDLTGQRARKAMARLNAIDRKVAAVGAVLELAQSTMLTGDAKGAESADQHLLNGPALPSEAMTQREIDRIMSMLDRAADRKAIP